MKVLWGRLKVGGAFGAPGLKVKWHIGNIKEHTLISCLFTHLK